MSWASVPWLRRGEILELRHGRVDGELAGVARGIRTDDQLVLIGVDQKGLRRHTDVEVVDALHHLGQGGRRVGGDRVLGPIDGDVDLAVADGVVCRREGVVGCLLVGGGERVDAERDGAGLRCAEDGDGDCGLVGRGDCVEIVEVDGIDLRPECREPGGDVTPGVVLGLVVTLARLQLQKRHTFDRQDLVDQRTRIERCRQSAEAHAWERHLLSARASRLGPINGGGGSASLRTTAPWFVDPATTE